MAFRGATHFSRRYSKVPTWSANILATSATAIRVGEVVTGALSATYGGYMAEIPESRRPTSPAEWEMRAKAHTRNPALEPKPIRTSGPSKDYKT